MPDIIGFQAIQPPQNRSAILEQPKIEPQGSLEGKLVQVIDPPLQDSLLAIQDQPVVQQTISKPILIQAGTGDRLSGKAQHAMLPDGKRMIAQCGRPKDDIFFGMIKMSSAYKSVLGHLDCVQQALSQTERDPLDLIDDAMKELDDLEQVTDAYIAEPGKHRFRAEMLELKAQIGETRTLLAGLHTQATVSGIWPDGLSVKEALRYARLGISLSDAAFFHQYRLEPEDAREMLLTDGNTLENLRTQISQTGKTVPANLSLREAVGYLRAGILPERASFLKQNGIPPEVAGKAVAGGYADDLPRMRNETAHFLAETAQALRQNLRTKGPQILSEKTLESSVDDSHRDLARLVSQSEQATELFLALFDTLPSHIRLHDDGTLRSRQELSGMIEQIPLRELSPEKRETAALLLNLIHENQQLAHDVFTTEDTRFRMPESATLVFGHNEGGKTNKDALSENVSLAQGLLRKTLQGLIPPQKLIPGGNNLPLIATHIQSLLQYRPDISVAFGILSRQERIDILKDWMNGLPSLDGKDKTALLGEDAITTLLGHVDHLTPNLGRNLLEDTTKAPLAKGGFGTVREATFNGVPVIVKHVKATDSAKTGNSYGEYIVEALRQAELRDNPNIPRILGVQVDPVSGELLIVMEKVNGTDYSKILKERFDYDPRAKLPPTTVNPLCAQRAKIGIHAICGMAKGLEPLHAHGLVHGDLKPNNVMLDGNTLEPRLIDFGGCISPEEGKGALTPVYCAPEQSEGYTGLPSDIYALGATLYASITNRTVNDLYVGTIEVTTRDDAELFGDQAFWDSSPVLKESRAFIRACIAEDPETRPTLQQILQAIRGETVIPALGTLESPGITANQLHVLDVLRPDHGYAKEARELLIQ